MRQCEFCQQKHDGLFATGRFCDISCSRRFAAKSKKPDTNERIRSSVMALNSKRVLACKQELDSISKDDLQEYASRVKSFKEMLRLIIEDGKLLTKSSKAVAILSDIAFEKRLLIRHFRMKWTKENSFKVQTDKVPSSIPIRRLMLQDGMKYECQICQMGPVWMGKELTLEVDHINGNKFDNRKENLRFLCPNCHHQTKTWGWQGKKKYDSPL